MADSHFVGHLCATHVGGELLMIGDETVSTGDTRWIIYEIRFRQNHQTVLLVIHPISFNKKENVKALYLEPDVIVTIKT